MILIQLAICGKTQNPKRQKEFRNNVLVIAMNSLKVLW